MTRLRREPPSRLLEGQGWPLRCPRCGGHLATLVADGSALVGGATTLACPADGWRGRLDEGAGIWDLYHAREPETQARFVDDYRQVRHAEGRGAGGLDALRRLPWAAPADPLADMWRIRARSFGHLDRRVLRQLPPGRRVLDLGAGNGWLSRRLARGGHRPAALDVFTDPEDGLAAAARAAAPWRYPCIRADFDHLPLDDGCADVVIFNAALHYSPEPRTTLQESLRVLDAAGLLVVLDSPCYAKASQGRRMVVERRARYRARYGFASDALGSREFLVPSELEAIGAELGLRWRRSRPWLGLQMASRPLVARLRRRRPPASFPLWVGRRVV